MTDPIKTWLDSLPDRGDQSLVGVPPKELRRLIEERDNNTALLFLRLIEERENNTALLHLLARIREAAGDSEGKLMQDELVEHIRKLREQRDIYEHSHVLWSLLEHDIRIAYDLPTRQYRAWWDDDPETEAWADYAHHAVEQLLEGGNAD